VSSPSTAPAGTEDPRPQLRVVTKTTPTGGGPASGDVPIGSSDRPEPPDGGPTRDAREPAREGSPSPAPADEISGTGSRVRAAARRIAGYASPPDIWSQDRPCLRKQLNYARWGQQHPEGGPLRWLSIALCCLGFVPQAAAYGLAWAAERPGRLAGLYVLLAVFVHLPVVRVVLVIGARIAVAPLTWLV
jgi:hypothetical protein